MNMYRMYSSPKYETEAVKRGWSWPAFCLGGIWAFCKGMWYISLGVVVLGFALFMFMVYFCDGCLANLIINIYGFVVSILLGIYGNEFRESDLLERGFNYVGEIEALNVDSALAEQLKRDEKRKIRLRYRHQPS